MAKTGRLPRPYHTGSLLWPNPIHSNGVITRAKSSFSACRHYQGEIILLCVRCYLRYALSYRDLEEMIQERGLSLDHTTIYRWVQAYAPELEKRISAYLRLTNDSYRVDEAYVKINGKWTCFYRAMDCRR